MDRPLIGRSAEGVQIRPACQADTADIRELTRSAYATWVPVIGREPVPMVADYDRAVREHMIDLLFVGSRLAALIETVHGVDHLFIENVAVLPASRDAATAPAETCGAACGIAPNG